MKNMLHLVICFLMEKEHDNLGAELAEWLFKEHSQSRLELFV